ATAVQGEAVPVELKRQPQPVRRRREVRAKVALDAVEQSVNACGVEIGVALLLLEHAAHPGVSVTDGEEGFVLERLFGAGQDFANDRTRTHQVLSSGREAITHEVLTAPSLFARQHIYMHT